VNVIPWKWHTLPCRKWFSSQKTSGLGRFISESLLHAPEEHVEYILWYFLTSQSSYCLHKRTESRSFRTKKVTCHNKTISNALLFYGTFAWIFLFYITLLFCLTSSTTLTEHIVVIVYTTQFVALFIGGSCLEKKQSSNAYLSQSTRGLRALLRKHVSSFWFICQ
jgi:hypothetical protein